MRRLLLVLLCCWVAVIAIAQSNPPKTDTPATVEQEGRDGSSYSKAIIIIASNDTAGAAQESEWIRARYPGYRMGKQSTSFYNDRSYDVVHFTDAHGVKHKVYFDITSFYGRR